MKRVITFSFLMILILFILTYLFFPNNAIGIYDENKNTVKEILVQNESKICIEYDHSVMKTPVRDIFHIKDNKELLLKKTEYKSFGAGLPSDVDEDIKKENGIFVKDNINQRFEKISLRVGKVANHRLIIDENKKIHLSDYIDSKDLVKIKPTSITNIKAFILERRN